jgi:hypothetical protein
LKTFLALLVAFSSTLGHSFAMAQSSEASEPEQKLTVVVLAGEQLDLVRIGAMVFGNKRSSVKLADNTFHETIAAAIASELKIEGRYRIETVIPSQAESASTRKAIQDAIGGFFTRSFSTVPAELSALTQQSQCSRLLLVLGTFTTDGPNSNQSYGPIAWVAGSGFGDEPSRSALSIPLEYILVDPIGVKLLASAGSTDDDNYRFADSPIDPKLWHRPMLEVSSDAWAALHHAAKTLMSKSVKRPLFKVGLRPSCALRFQPPQRVRPGEPRPEQPVPAGADPAKCS